MVAVLLSLVVAFLVGGSAWLIIGSRLALNEDGDVNEVLNLVAYVAMALIPVFLGIFYVLDRN